MKVVDFLVLSIFSFTTLLSCGQTYKYYRPHEGSLVQDGWRVSMDVLPISWISPLIEAGKYPEPFLTESAVHGVDSSLGDFNFYFIRLYILEADECIRELRLDSTLSGLRLRSIMIRDQRQNVISVGGKQQYFLAMNNPEWRMSLDRSKVPSITAGPIGIVDTEEKTLEIQITYRLLSDRCEGSEEYISVLFNLDLEKHRWNSWNWP